MAYQSFVTISLSLIFVVLAFGEIENTETLMTAAKFHEALFALEPLIATETKKFLYAKS